MLSVVVPVYNSAKYLNTCLQSLVAQTYTDLEIILVDDGSTDVSPAICDWYAEKYEFIRVMHKQNGGVHDARNIGLENSNGDVIAFIDSDDLMDPQAFEIMIQVLEKTDADVVACGFKTEYGKIKLEQYYKDIPSPREFLGGTAAAKGISNGLTGFIWNKIIRKDVIGDLRFRDDIPICDDLFFNYQLMLRINKAALIDLPFYHYRYVAVSLSKTAPISRYMGCLAGMERLVNWIEVHVPECVGDIRANFIFWNTKTCEQMLNDYHPKEFEKIQSYIKESKEYISKCSIRIRLLAYAIMKSWNAYRLCGHFFLSMKRIYVKIIQIKD